MNIVRVLILTLLIGIVVQLDCVFGQLIKLNKTARAQFNLHYMEMVMNGDIVLPTPTPSPDRL